MQHTLKIFEVILKIGWYGPKSNHHRVNTVTICNFEKCLHVSVCMSLCENRIYHNIKLSHVSMSVINSMIKKGICN